MFSGVCLTCHALRDALGLHVVGRRCVSSGTRGTQQTGWTSTDHHRTCADRPRDHGARLARRHPVPHYGVLAVSSFEVGSRSRSPVLVEAKDGRFVLDLQPGTSDVIVVGPGFARRTLLEQPVTQGHITDLGDIEVKHGFTIDGQVTDVHGLPVTGARVSVSQSFDRREKGELTDLLEGKIFTTTDQHGHYVIRGFTSAKLEGGAPSIMARRFGDASFPIRLPYADSKVDLIVEPAGRIAGSVERPDPGAIVTVEWSPKGTVWFSWVDADGTFGIDDLPVGDYQVTVSGRLRWVPRLVRVTADTLTLLFKAP